MTGTFHRTPALASGITKSALLLGNYRPAVAVARALSGAGYSVIMGLEGDEGGTELSRHVAETWDHPLLAEDRDGFLSSLAQYLKAHPDIVTVVPVSEEFVSAFAACGWQPPAHVTLASPAHDTVRLFLDKPSTLALARDTGIPTLPFKVTDSHESLVDAARSIGWPNVVKPLVETGRIGTKKAVISDDEADLIGSIPEWPSDHTRLLVQKYATGQRHNVYFAARNGRLTGICASRILRTNNPDGTGLAISGETIEPPVDLLRDTEKLAASSNYTGIGLTQFIIDPATGDRCFLELNPRISGSHAVADEAGVPLSLMAVQLAQEASSQAPSPPVVGRSGLRYVWTSGALMAAKLDWRRGETGFPAMMKRIGAALSDALRADIHMVWRADDPGPGLRALASTAPNFNTALRLAGVLFRRLAGGIANAIRNNQLGERT